MLIFRNGLVLLLLLSGCTTYETYPETAASPIEAWSTIRAALLSKDPHLLFRCLSPDFKERREVGSLARFMLAFQMKEGEFDDLAALVENAVPGEPVVLSGEPRSRVVRLPITAHGRTIHLVFVEVPTFTVRMDSESYDYYGAWDGAVSFEDDRLRIDRPIDPALALESSGEIEGLRFHVRWLLDGISMP